MQGLIASELAVWGLWEVHGSRHPVGPLAPSALPASFSAPRASWCSCPREVQSRPRCPRAEHFRAGQPGISGVGAPLPAGEEEGHLGNPTQTSPQPTRHGTFSEHPGLFPVLNKTPKVKGLSAVTHGCPQRVLMSSPQNPWGFNFTTCVESLRSGFALQPELRSGHPPLFSSLPVGTCRSQAAATVPTALPRRRWARITSL